MYFANPLGLLGLLALPVIVAIHLYHRRFPPMMVAGLHLWSAETQVRAAGRRRDRLPITASLLLELLAALLLTLVLSGPRIGSVSSVAHMVVVLDNSASMMGTPSEEPQSFRDAAIEVLKQRIDRLPRGSVVTVILTGRRPIMLAGPAIPWDQAEPLLRRWQPSEPQHEFQPAWDLASQLAEQSGDLLFLTDLVPRQDMPVPKNMEVVSVGRSLDNVAITAARWTFDSKSATGHVFVRLSNLGRETANVGIRGIDATDTPIFERTSEVAEGASIPFEATVSGGLGRLRLEVRSAGDGLAIDNTVTLIEPKIRMLTLALTIPQDHSANRLTRRVLQAIPDVQLGGVSNADLVISPAEVGPTSGSERWWLGVGPLDSTKEARQKAKDVIGPYLLEKRDPLLEGLVLGGVVWGGIQPCELRLSPLISAGREVLLSRLVEAPTTAYLLNIDLARSNLGESPDWPILLSNLVHLRRESLPGLRRWNYRLDEEIQFRLREVGSEATAESVPKLVLLHKQKTRRLARTAIVELPPLDLPGVYTIQDGEQEVGQFSVNFFDARESTLTGLRPGIQEPLVAADSAAYAVDNPYSWLILLGIALIILVAMTDWYVLRPRHTAS